MSAEYYAAASLLSCALKIMKILLGNYRRTYISQTRGISLTGAGSHAVVEVFGGQSAVVNSVGYSV